MIQSVASQYIIVKKSVISSAGYKVRHRIDFTIQDFIQNRSIGLSIIIIDSSSHECPFEDWWIDPSEFNIDLIEKLKCDNTLPSVIISKFS